jgi:UDP-N-acetylmuramate--alanine ligase
MKLDFENKYKSIYFIGIGGVSMSGLAQILLQKGLKVSGSDMKKSPSTQRLEKLGVNINYGHKYENILDSIDLVVYTAAVKEDNPEIMAAKDKNITVVERAVLLGSIMDNYSRSIAVAGTHGKTTTTSMVSEILLAADADPTITIGGTLSTINGNIKVGNSEYFVAEACEYHDSFLKFDPFVAVILNIEAEHLDYFKDINQIRTSFKGFAQNTSPSGYVVINSADPAVEYITKDLKSSVVTFGIDKEKSMWYPENIVHNENGTNSFDIYFEGRFMGHANLNIPGDHNILNALAACAASTAVGIKMSSIIKGLEHFTGTNRRFQYKGTFNGVTVIDDYAHHPTEVKATLAAAKHVKHETLWCIFQPHTYTRAKALLKDFGKAFEDADKIIVADIYAAREKDTGLIHARDVAEEIKLNGKNAQYLGDFNSIIEYVKKEAKPGDLLITMGAGDVYTVGESLINM